MTAVAVPITWHGIEVILKGATTVIGFFTAVCGLGIGILGLLWWFRKYRRDSARDREIQ